MKAKCSLGATAGEPARRVRGRRSTAGSSLIEAVFVTPFIFGLIWLAWNLCWALFAKSSLQVAVDLGARAAVTGLLQAGGTDLMTSVAGVAQKAAPVFLTHSRACSNLSIQFYDQTGTAVSAPVSQGIVTVSIAGYPYTLIAPIMSVEKAKIYTQPVATAGPGISVTASRVSQPLDPLTNVSVGTWPSGCS